MSQNSISQTRTKHVVKMKPLLIGSEVLKEVRCKFLRLKLKDRISSWKRFRDIQSQFFKQSA